MQFQKRLIHLEHSREYAENYFDPDNHWLNKICDGETFKHQALNRNLFPNCSKYDFNAQLSYWEV